MGSRGPDDAQQLIPHRIAIQIRLDKRTMDDAAG
jgi:hypothetical protein